jgi:hypothetical protein
VKTKSLPIRQTGLPDFARDTLNKQVSISHSGSARLNDSIIKNERPHDIRLDPHAKYYLFILVEMPLVKLSFRFIKKEVIDRGDATKRREILSN